MALCEITICAWSGLHAGDTGDAISLPALSRCLGVCDANWSAAPGDGIAATELGGVVQLAPHCHGPCRQRLHRHSRLSTMGHRVARLGALLQPANAARF